MENKYQVVALIGKAGAGKDTIQTVTCNKHPLLFNKIISCTTRPMREGEAQGVDYNFISLEDFTRRVLNSSMLEATEFKGWFYGTPEDTLVKDKINIGVFNPAGVEALLEDSRLNVLTIDVQAPDKERLMRYLMREEHPDCAEMCRRYFTDEKDFSDLDFEYISIDNSNGAPLDLMNENLNLASSFEEMWSALGTDTEFETIIRWESTMSIKAEPAKVEDNDN